MIIEEKKMSKSILRFVMILCLIMTIFTSLSRSAAFLEEQDEDAKAYRQAYNFILDEKWNDAIKGFDDFIKKYPQSGWIDDAQYWHGVQNFGQTENVIFGNRISSCCCHEFTRISFTRAGLGAFTAGVTHP